MTHHTIILSLTNEEIHELVEKATGTASEDIVLRAVHQALGQEQSAHGPFVTTVDHLRSWLSSFPSTTPVTINSRPIHFSVKPDGTIELHS